MQSPVSMATSFSSGDGKKQALVSAGINQPVGAGYLKESTGEGWQEPEGPGGASMGLWLLLPHSTNVCGFAHGPSSCGMKEEYGPPVLALVPRAVGRC